METPPPTGIDHATLLEQHLAAHEDPCPMCGYNLHNLRGDKCPECGQELTLHIALAEPRLAAFYTGLVGLAAGLGFCSLVLVWGLLVSLFRGGPRMWQLALLGGETVVLAALLAAWLHHSGRIRRLRQRARWTLALLTWVVAFGAMLLFGMAVQF